MRFTAILWLGLVSTACGSDTTRLLPGPVSSASPSALPSVANGPRGPVAATSRQRQPSFSWALRESGPAAVRIGPPPSIEAAARGHIAAVAGAGHLSANVAAALELRDIHDIGKGAIIARFGRRIDGVEVFGEQIAVALDRHLEPVAFSGYVTESQPTVAKARATAAVQSSAEPVGAVIAAIAELTAVTLDPSELDVSAELAGQYRSVAVQPLARTRAGIDSDEPARVKAVFYPVAEGQAVSAQYVEVYLGDDAVGRPRSFSFVVDSDGRILWSKDLAAFDNAYSYRVYADATGLLTPWDGPQGTAPTPHPSGLPDNYQAPFVAPQLVTLSSLVEAGVNDPWLPPAATTTLGNNVDAYVDLAAPDGFTPGLDFRGVVSAPGAFDYPLAPDADAATEHQRMSGLAQVFYDVNWFHDWYYAAGFTESAGNGQFSNYGRGGIEGDGLRVETQDSSFWNSANMMTPADGARPRMQMHPWDHGATRLTIESPESLRGEYRAGAALFAPRQFDLAGRILRADPPDGCEAISGDVANAIVFVEGEGCEPAVKAEFVQAAGAIGMLIATPASLSRPTFAWYPSGDPVEPIGIGVLSLNQADSQRLRVALGTDEPIAGRLSRNSVLRDSAFDNQIVAHEWGHYISNRLVGDATGLDTNMAVGLGEGWGDFHALLMSVRAEDALEPGNGNYGGVYAIGSYAPASSVSDPYYFGSRRYPYSTDLRTNPLTFKHISDDAVLPDDVPRAADGSNVEVHALGEVWATMLWECYAALLRDSLGSTPRLSFAEARDRMRDYLVAAYKLTPRSPTLLEARDALLAAAFINDPADHALFVNAFAKRGAGVFAVAPDRFDTNNFGVVESYAVGAALVATGAELVEVAAVCHADGSVDDGETANLRLTIANVGNAATGTLNARVSSSTEGLLFPAGTSVAVPALPVRGTTRVSLPVAARALVGITTYAFSVDLDDAGAGHPPPQTFEMVGNFDRWPFQSFTDAAESPHVVWTVATAPALAPGSGWQRIAKTLTDHAYGCATPDAAATLDFVSPRLLMIPGEPLTLAFRHRHRFEANDTSAYDGGVIEISRDGGSTWQDVGSAAPYNGTLYPDSENPLGGRAAFVGESPGYPAFQPLSLTLDPRGASAVLIRFRVASDLAVSSPGWELDDLTLTGVMNAPFDSEMSQPSRCNEMPIAVAGDQFVVDTDPAPPFAATRITLDGSASFDADGDTLTYRWTQLGGPPVTLDDPHAQSPTFRAPDAAAAVRQLDFQLVVHDGALFSKPALVRVTVFDSAVAAASQDAGASSAEPSEP